MRAQSRISTELAVRPSREFLLAESVFELVSLCVLVCVYACLVKHCACRQANRHRQRAGEWRIGELTNSLRRTHRIRNILRVGYQK